jgi:tRNA (guanine-N7-)-methyltransferase
VELGSGKGRFLLAWAAAHPEIGILAVERARKYAELAAARAVREGLGNVRIAATTAEDLLFRCLSPGSVGGCHVYFPDPWPKKKHQKRRFFRPDNLQRLVDLLQPGGMLWVKTDHPDYAAVIGPLLAAQPGLESHDEVEAFAAMPATNFEIKYAREERPIHRFAFRRL